MAAASGAAVCTGQYREGNLKLADFGLARSFSNDHNGNLTNRVITRGYSLELFFGNHKVWSGKLDMWSVGYEVNWPGVSKIPWYNNFKPSRPMKRRVRETYKHFDRHALELLERMLTLDPSQRISAKDALDAEYFWTDPLPCDPKSLPKYESSHEFQTKKKRQQQRQHEEEAAVYEATKIHKEHRARLPFNRPTKTRHDRHGPNQPMHSTTSGGCGT
ncbi:hypothetical protein IFM89_018844 [Coptis chinensis]|uniref:Protein kinase domain-containing protein n=1 Tax=Coptis chinensis TaxID=261450 RepID=A0A835I3H9_9MAGN|nr:hypothetical protein IFM89_018844 [Coptis chinensis]